PPRVGGGDGADQAPHLVVRPRIQRLERRATRAGQRAQVAPAVLLRRLALDPTPLLEALQDPTQVSGVETELSAQVGGRRVCSVRELVEHARLRERERAFQQAFLEDADL